MDNKYQNAKIYKIVTENSNQIYIGSTTESLKRRLQKHECAYRNQNGDGSSNIILRQGGYSIQLIKDFPCNSRGELAREEGVYIQSMDCINLLVAGRTRQETLEAYYKKHNKKLDCECGGKFTHQSKAIHLKTKKHKDFLLL